MSSTAVVRPRGEDRIRSGHPWIYRSDVAEVAAEPGAVVEVFNGRKRSLGHALYSAESQITLRMITTEAREIDSSFWHDRLEAAIRFRQSLGIDATAFRLVHGEADLLPSLIVDRYADYLVIQTLSQGMDRLMPVLVSSLMELTGARGILARNDPKVRLLEGLEQTVEVVVGEVPETIDVREGRIN